MLAIHCMPDHTHLFVGLKPIVYIPDFIKEIKVESNEFINSKKWIKGKFNWQEGYGVFSYSHSQIDNVVKYILNQEQHHQKKTFKQEYPELLKKFEISFEEKYLFDFIEWEATTEPITNIFHYYKQVAPNGAKNSTKPNPWLCGLSKTKKQ